MTTAVVLDREEYIEQAYFFRTLRERLATNLPAQEVLERVPRGDPLDHPAPLRHPVPGHRAEAHRAARLGVRPPAALLHAVPGVRGAARPRTRGCDSACEAALLVLEREAAYRADKPTPPGLFVYQFETLSRNRLGYDDGLRCLAGDPLYDQDWRGYLEMVRQQLGSGRLRRPGLRALRAVRPRSETPGRDLRTAPAAPVRREGRPDRQGQPPPRPALPVRRPAAAARLPRGAPPAARGTTPTPSWKSCGPSCARWRHASSWWRANCAARSI